MGEPKGDPRFEACVKLGHPNEVWLMNKFVPRWWPTIGFVL